MLLTKPQCHKAERNQNGHMLPVIPGSSKRKGIKVATEPLPPGGAQSKEESKWLCNPHLLRVPRAGKVLDSAWYSVGWGAFGPKKLPGKRPARALRVPSAPKFPHNGPRSCNPPPPPGGNRHLAEKA